MIFFYLVREGNAYNYFDVQHNFIIGHIGNLNTSYRSSSVWLKVNRLSGGGMVIGFDNVDVLEGNLFDRSMYVPNDLKFKINSWGSDGYNYSMIVWAVFIGVAIAFFGLMVPYYLILCAYF